MNKVEVKGGSFESVCERAKAKSLTKEYKGCGVHINAIVAKLPPDSDGGLSRFAMSFSISDWFSSDSTVRTYVNGDY